MTTPVAKPSSVPAGVAHWAGCLLGTALVLLFAVFAVGDGARPQLLLNPQTWALFVMLAGFLFAWWRELAGGFLSLAGIRAFYALNYAAAGTFPGGWLFPLCFVPGGLNVLAWLLRRGV